MLTSKLGCRQSRSLLIVIGFLLLLSALAFIVLSIPALSSDLLHITLPIILGYGAFATIKDGLDIVIPIPSVKEIIDTTRGVNIGRIRHIASIMEYQEDDYLHRCQLEDELEKALPKPLKQESKLVILTGEEGSGKTATIQALVRERLSYKYNGLIIYRDMDELPLGDFSTEEIATQKSIDLLTRTVLDETIENIKESGEWKGPKPRKDERKPAALKKNLPSWLVIFDHVNNETPMEHILSYFLVPGVTILIITRDQDYTVQLPTHRGKQLPINKIMHMPPLKSGELRNMARYYSKPKRFTTTELERLEKAMLLTTPDSIKVAGISRASGTEIENIIDALKGSGNPEEKLHRAVHLVTKTFTREQQKVIAAFALIEGNTISDIVLKEMLTYSDQQTDPNKFISSSISRQFRLLRSLPNKTSVHRFAITDSGRNLARSLINIDPQIEIDAGALLLHTYHTLSQRLSGSEIEKDFSTIIGIMAWAIRPPRRLLYLQEYQIDFPLMLSKVFYQQGPWDRGHDWLQFGMQRTNDSSEKQKLGNLALIDSRILLAEKDSMQGLVEIEKSKTWFNEDIETKTFYIQRQAGDVSQLQNDILSDSIQLVSLRLLEVSAIVQLQINANEDSSLNQDLNSITKDIEALFGKIEEEIQHLESSSNIVLNELVVSIKDQFILQKIQYMLRLSEFATSTKDYLTEALDAWKKLSKHIGKEKDTKYNDIKPLYWRLGGVISRIQVKNNVNYQESYREGVNYLHQSLKYSRNLGLLSEEILSLYEEARLLITMRVRTLADKSKRFQLHGNQKIYLRKAHDLLQITYDKAHKLGSDQILSEIEELQNAVEKELI